MHLSVFGIASALCVVGGTTLVQRRKPRDHSSDFRLGNIQFMQALEVQPEIRAGSEEMSETQCGISGDGALPVQNLGHPIRGHLDVSGQFRRAHVQETKLFSQVLTWVHCQSPCIFRRMSGQNSLSSLDTASHITCVPHRVSV